MPLVKTPMIAPTKIYDKFPTISPAQAADMVVRALVDQPHEINTALGHRRRAGAHARCRGRRSGCCTWPTGSSPTPPPPGRREARPSRSRPPSSSCCWPGSPGACTGRSGPEDHYLPDRDRFETRCNLFPACCVVEDDVSVIPGEGDAMGALSGSGSTRPSRWLGAVLAVGLVASPAALLGTHPPRPCGAGAVLAAVQHQRRHRTHRGQPSRRSAGLAVAAGVGHSHLEPLSTSRSRGPTSGPRSR